MDAESLDEYNWQYCVILYKVLEYPWILVSEKVLEPIPIDIEGWLYMGSDSRWHFRIDFFHSAWF